MTILVTGATGFVGARLLASLKEKKLQTRAAIRNPSSAIENAYVVGNINGHTNWAEALKGAATVFHCAARAHQKDNDGPRAIKEFNEVNVEGTSKLLQDCAEAGVRKFIYISSIKVNGDANKLGRPYNETDSPTPDDAYGRSKTKAEEQVKRFCEQHGIVYAIVRPPLVYGPGVKANFKKLIDIAKKGYPVPLGLAKAPRSLIYIDNLVDFIVRLLGDDTPDNQIWFVSDDHDMSVAELFSLIKSATGSRSLSLWVPVTLMVFCLMLFGKKGVATRLFKPLTVNINKAKTDLDWKPPFKVDDKIFKKVCE